jgi:hypothetical protein
MSLRSLAALALLLALVLLAPVSIAADICVDCTRGSAAGCCPPACGACLCCGPSASLRDAHPAVVPGGEPARTDWPPADERPTPRPPRSVFHVPKPTS